MCHSKKPKNININIYRNKLWPVVLYGYETCSLTLREESRLTVFENKVLRRKFGPKTDRGGGDLHIEERNDLYSSPNTIRVSISRRLRWAGHVASMGRAAVHTGFWWGNLRERDHLEDPSLDGWIILRWIFREWDGECTGFIWPRIGAGSVSL